MTGVSAFDSRLAAIAIFALALYSMPARAGWLEASSQHFIIYSDTSEKALREFASRLESFDSGLRRIFMAKTAPEDAGRRSNRLRIFVLVNPGSVQRLYSSRDSTVMGFYLPRVGGSVAFTPRRSPGNVSENDLSAQTILLHEYTHHFLFTNFSAAYPPWFSEGFAELNSTTRFERNGDVSFGLPANHRVRSLFGMQFLKIEDLLDSSRRKLDSISLDELYSRGWLLTHYLFFTPGRQEQLLKYIGAINNGTPNLEAARANFGDLGELDRELDRHLKRPISFIRIPAKDVPTGPIDIKPLTAGAAAMMPVHIRSTRGVDSEGAREVVLDARKLAAPYPSDPDVQVQLAEAEFDAGNLDEAEAAADRALSIDGMNREALLYKGRVAMARATAAHSKDAKVWNSARMWFVKANKTDPNVAEPLALFYMSFQEAGEEPTKNAVLGLKRAFELAPEDRNLRYTVALQALNDDMPKLARSVLAPLAYDPHNSQKAQRLLAAIDLLDAGKKAEAIDALKADPEPASQPGS